MRITFLNSLYPPHGASGAENSVRLVANRMQARGHTCSILTLTPDTQECEGEIDGIPVRYLPLANVYWPHGGSRPGVLRPVFQTIEAYNLLMGRRTAAALAKLQPQVLNCHNLQGFSVAAWRAADALGVPVVQTIHDYYLACPRSAMWRPSHGNCSHQCKECHIFTTPRRILSKIPACVTCVSYRVMDRITDAGTFPEVVAGRQPARIVRGLNPESSPESSVAKPRLARSATTTFGFMGRLEPSKGVEALLDAFAGLPPGAARLLVAGSGPQDYVAKLHERARDIDGVKFLGHVPPDDFFVQIDLLVIPSVWEDPFPRVFHEALTFGVASLVTPLGGLPEVIHHGRDGFVAGGVGAAALKQSLTRLLTEGWDRDAVRLACKAKSTEYEAEHITTQYERVLVAAGAREPIPENAGSVWRPRHMRDDKPSPVAGERVFHGI